MDFENITINRSSLAEHVADKLEAMILADNSAMDKKLPSEQMLAAGFHVSRTVIREAVIILKGRGLISKNVGNSPRIQQPAANVISETVSRIIRARNISCNDILTARIEIEMAAAGLVDFQHVALEDLIKLEQINEKMAGCSHDPRLRAQLDMEFHSQLANLSGNALMTVFIDSLTPLLLNMLTATLTRREVHEDGIDFHRKIIQQLRSRQEHVQLLRDHLLLSGGNCEAIQKNPAQDN